MIRVRMAMVMTWQEYFNFFIRLKLWLGSTVKRMASWLMNTIKMYIDNN
jgi:hypothetical protein